MRWAAVGNRSTVIRVESLSMNRCHSFGIGIVYRREYLIPLSLGPRS